MILVNVDLGMSCCFLSTGWRWRAQSCCTCMESWIREYAAWCSPCAAGPGLMASPAASPAPGSPTSPSPSWCCSSCRRGTPPSSPHWTSYEISQVLLLLSLCQFLVSLDKVFFFKWKHEQTFTDMFLQHQNTSTWKILKTKNNRKKGLAVLKSLNK